MKRHQILGKNLHTTLEECLYCFARREKEYPERTIPEKKTQQFTRELYISEKVSYAVFDHLGYGPTEGLREHLDRGVDEALEYFFGDWWQRCPRDSRALDKTRWNRELRWFSVLSNALLLCGLTGRWDDAEKICSWFDDSIRVEYQGGMIEDEYMLMFLRIASDLSPQPMAKVDIITEYVKKCRARRPRQLLALWEAAMAADQKAFDKALAKAVKHFLKYDAEDVPNFNFWVALHPSFVWLVAERNGLQFPDLPEELDAAVVRRQTIGLD